MAIIYKQCKTRILYSIKECKFFIKYSFHTLSKINFSFIKAMVRYLISDVPHSQDIPPF